MMRMIRKVFVIASILILSFTPVLPARAQGPQKQDSAQAAPYKGGEVIVAVLDTGVQTGRPAIRRHLWINILEVPGDGQDNDGNGYADDRWGYDLTDVELVPEDRNGHGTAVAATVLGDLQGRSADAGGVYILPVKVLGDNGRGYVSDVVDGILYCVAVQRHTKKRMIINLSLVFFGSPPEDYYEAIRQAERAGILVVAAAGNNGGYPRYPAAGYEPNVVSVAATDGDRLASFSARDAEQVDLAAPGVGIMAPNLTGGYEKFNGTSAAAPHVSRAAALVWRANNKWDYKRVRDQLVGSVDKLPNLTGACKSGGRLNADKAVAAGVP